MTQLSFTSRAARENSLGNTDSQSHHTYLKLLALRRTVTAIDSTKHCDQENINEG